MGVGGNEDDKELRRPDADDQREKESESVGNSLGETHCRRNVNPNY